MAEPTSPETLDPAGATLDFLKAFLPSGKVKVPYVDVNGDDAVYEYAARLPLAKLAQAAVALEGIWGTLKSKGADLGSDPTIAGMFRAAANMIVSDKDLHKSFDDFMAILHPKLAASLEADDVSFLETFELEELANLTLPFFAKYGVMMDKLTPQA